MRFSPGFRRFAQILYAIGVVVLSAGVLMLLRPYLSISTIALLFLVPVVASAAAWGRLAGIAASALSFLIFNYFFIHPLYTFWVTQPQDFLSLIVLLSVAILISSLMSRVQSNLAMVREREREAIQLYEFSKDLTVLRDEQAVARIVERHLAEIFAPARVMVLVKGQDATPLPASGAEVRRVPVTSQRGELGEIWLWEPANSLTPEQERLLQTCAGQAGLALDRLVLSASETRARVLEESDRLKTAILSSVSHELRTPLATIQASATSLFNPSVDLVPEARAELQGLLLEETDRMAQLVGNLLNMSRLEAGALKLQRQWNAFSEIVDACVQRLRRGAARQRLNVEVPDDLPLVALDPVLMEQVLMNLVSNSLKFSPQETTISISAEAGEQELQATVSNLGPPIPAEHIDHIFEKFYPIPGRDPSRSTGLGLSICKGIIEAHGGRIWAENLPVGVAFRFTLPLTWGGARPVLPAAEEET